MSSTKWANLDDDAGALHALLGHIEQHVGVDPIDLLWIFPARPIAAGESVVIVVSAFDADPGRRRVITALFTVARNPRGAARVTTAFDEHASAPTAAVRRVVDGVLRRLGEEVGAEPREEAIHGEPDRWAALIRELGGTSPASAHADQATGTGEPADAGDEVNADQRTEAIGAAPRIAAGTGDGADAAPPA